MKSPVYKGTAVEPYCHEPPYRNTITGSGAVGAGAGSGVHTFRYRQS